MSSIINPKSMINFGTATQDQLLYLDKKQIELILKVEPKAHIRIYSSEETANRVLSIIQKREKGALARFGDGDTRIANGLCSRTHRNAGNIKNLQKDMKESFGINHPNYLRSLCLYFEDYATRLKSVVSVQRIYDKIQREIQTTSKLWVGPRSIYSPYSMIWLLHENEDRFCQYMYNISHAVDNIIFVGNKNIPYSLVQSLFYNQILQDRVIECPVTNAGLVFEDIWKSIDSKMKELRGYTLVVLCCGNTGRALCGRLWKSNYNRNYFVLDYGSLIDGLAGYTTRSWIKGSKICTKEYRRELFNRMKNK
jgi:hypothetical protein